MARHRITGTVQVSGDWYYIGQSGGAIHPPDDNGGALPTAWITGGGAAFVRQLAFGTDQYNRDIWLVLAATDSGLGHSAGPNVTNAFRTSGRIALTVGGNSIVFEGIGGGDYAEPYQWRPSNHQAMVTFLANVSDGDAATIELDDGEVRIAGRLGVAGLGASSLRVIQGVRMAGRLGIAGLGAGQINVAQPASVRLRGRLGIVGLGSSRLQVVNLARFDMPLSAVDAGANRWSSANTRGSDDDIEIPSNFLAAGVTASIDWVRFRRNQVRIILSSPAPGRLAPEVERSAVLLLEDPSTSPATPWAAVQGLGRYWNNANDQYRINDDDAFLVGSRRALDDLVIAKSVGDVVRMRIVRPDAVRLAGRLSIGSVGQSTVRVSAGVRMVGRLPITGVGQSTVRVAAGVRMVGRLPIAGVGQSALAVRQPAAVRLAGRLPIAGAGQSELTVVAGVRIGGRLAIVGLGTSQVSVLATPADHDRADARALVGRDQVFALEIEHPDISEPVRVVADTAEHTVEGNTFVPLAFHARVPQSREGEVRNAVLRIDNVGEELMEWVDASDGGRGASMRVIRLIPPSTAGARAWCRGRSR